jgi:hypothetical protein
VISNQGTFFYDADGDGTNEATETTQNVPGGGPTTFVLDAGIPAPGTAGFALLVALLAMVAVCAPGRRRKRVEGGGA